MEAERRAPGEIRLPPALGKEKDVLKRPVFSGAGRTGFFVPGITDKED
jgi:hypothetical protein